MTIVGTANRIRGLTRDQRLTYYATVPADVLAAARYLDAFWMREVQRLPDPSEEWTLNVTVGDRGTGKSQRAMWLFLREIFSGRARRPRIIAATDAVLKATVVNGQSGIMQWLPPHLRPTWVSSNGFAGELTFRVAGRDVTCLCCSAAAPGQAIGIGVDLDWRDDPAGWVESCGERTAERAWIEASKSCRLGLGRAIVATTPDGADFVMRLARPGENSGLRLVDLGSVENNAGNLSRAYIRDTVADLRARGEWTQSKSGPFADVDFAPLILDVCPTLVELCIAIDPSRSSGNRACEVGIVGGGRDARSVVHVRHDVSAVLDAGANGWPAVAWDLAEEIQRQHPGVPWHFAMESNTGKAMAEHLRGEERIRRLRDGKPEVSVCEIRMIRADKDKCVRAESPARLARQRQVRFAQGLSRVEGQLRQLTPAGTKSDRADACVHLINDLAALGAQGKEDTTAAVRESFAGLGEVNRRIPAPAFGGGRYV